MSNKFYTGTAEQALALAEDTMRRHHEDDIAAQKIDSIEDAVDELVDEVDDLVETCRYASKRDLLSAIYKFSKVQTALNVLHIKVNQAYEFDEDDEDDE